MCLRLARSNRFPSVLLQPLEHLSVFKINNLRAACRRFIAHDGELPSADAITFAFSDLKRTEDGSQQKLCETSFSTLITYGPGDSASGQQSRPIASETRIRSSPCPGVTGCHHRCRRLTVGRSPCRSEGSVPRCCTGFAFLFKASETPPRRSPGSPSQPDRGSLSQT